MNLILEGRFQIIENGRVVVDTCNHITNQGLDILMALLTGGYGNHTIDDGATSLLMSNVSDWHDWTVETMQVTDKVSPTAPANDDTALEDTEVWTANRAGGDSTLNFSLTLPGVMAFTTLIPAVSSIDGTTLTEEGLFTANGFLVARSTFSKEKVNGTAVTLTHTFTIARA